MELKIGEIYEGKIEAVEKAEVPAAVEEEEVAPEIEDALEI